MVKTMGERNPEISNTKHNQGLSFSISRILDLHRSSENRKQEGKSEGGHVEGAIPTPDEGLISPTCYNKLSTVYDWAFSDQGNSFLPLSYSIWLQENRGASRRLGHPYQSRAPPKRKKQRASFSRSQIKELEKLFSKKKYLSSSERQHIAKKLDMTDCQVKTWYQNRRTKWKREKEEEKQEERQAMAKALMTTRNDWWPTKSVFGC